MKYSWTAELSVKPPSIFRCY